MIASDGNQTLAVAVASRNLLNREYRWTLPRIHRMVMASSFLFIAGLLLCIFLPQEDVHSDFQAPEFIRWFLGHPWWAVTVLAFFFCPVVMFVLASAWEGVFRLSQYQAFSVGDWIPLPILFGLFGLAVNMWDGTKQSFTFSINLWGWNGIDLSYAESEAVYAGIGFSIAFSLLNAINDKNKAGGWRKAFDSPYNFYHAVMLWFMVAVGLSVIGIVVVGPWWLPIATVIVFVLFSVFPAQDAGNKNNGTLPKEGRTVSQY